MHYSVKKCRQCKTAGESDLHISPKTTAPFNLLKERKKKQRK